MSLAALGAPGADEPVLAVRDVGTCLLVLEVNGWQGSRPEVLRRISAGARAVSVYWNLSMTTRFSYAVSGQVLTAPIGYPRRAKKHSRGSRSESRIQAGVNRRRRGMAITSSPYSTESAPTQPTAILTGSGG